MLNQSALRRVLRKVWVPKLLGVLVAGALAGAFLVQGALADGSGSGNNGGNSGNNNAGSNDGKTWAGIGWGIGIAADFDLGGKRVTNAVIDTVPGGSIVRVTDISGNVGVSFVLEAHYFPFEWQTGLNSCGKPGLNYNCNDIATGPFLAIEINGGNSASADAGPITGYALGWMVGLHHPDAASKTSSWNFGIGLRVDPKAKVLGDGVLANHAPPPGITTADQLIKTEPRYGIMLLSSFSF